MHSPAGAVCLATKCGEEEVRMNRYAKERPPDVPEPLP